MSIDLTVLTDNELYDLQNKVFGEWDRRRAQPFVEEAKTELTREAWEEAPGLKPRYTTSEEGEAPVWVQPESWIKGYPPKARVTHGGKTWVNALGTMNTTVPGESSAWAEWDPDRPLVATDVLPPYAPEPEPEAEPEGEVVEATEPAPEPEATPWKSGTTYKTGDRVTHNEVTYTVLADHRAGMTTPPPAAPGLYQPV